MLQWASSAVGGKMAERIAGIGAFPKASGGSYSGGVQAEVVLEEEYRHKQKSWKKKP